MSQISNDIKQKIERKSCISNSPVLYEKAATWGYLLAAEENKSILEAVARGKELDANLKFDDQPSKYETALSEIQKLKEEIEQLARERDKAEREWEKAVQEIESLKRKLDLYETDRFDKDEGGHDSIYQLE